MFVNNLSRNFLTLILLVSLSIIIWYYALGLHRNTHEPYRLGGSKKVKRFAITKHPINAPIDTSISNKRGAVPTAVTTIPNKTAIAKKAPDGSSAADILLPYPPIKPHESRDLDLNIDRVYGCGRKFINVIRSEEERIPRIIHFMWTTEIVPSVFVENLKSFVKHNPTWTYYFWTAVSSERFIKEKYPHLLKTFQGYKKYISRYDAARYIIMHHYGGAYFDLDTKSIKSIDPLLKTEECIVAPEPIEHASAVLGMRSLLGNCVFLCKPRHGFFAHALTELDKTKAFRDMMQAAGPKFFTKTFQTYIAGCLQRKVPANESIHVMSAEYFLDFVKKDVHESLKRRCNKDKTQRDTGPYIQEACAMWRKRHGEHRTLSAKAYTVHSYFATYVYKNKLDQRPENNIKNIIPNVKMYPD